MDEYYVVYINQKGRVLTETRKFKTDEDFFKWLSKRGAVHFECKVLTRDNQIRHIKQVQEKKEGFDWFPVH